MPIDTPSGPATFVRWRILALLVFASFTSYVLRYNVSAAGPAMISDLGLTEQQFGWILAAFTAGYALFQFPGGLLVVAVGARRILTIIMILWSALTLALCLVPDVNSLGLGATLALLIGLRFLTGVAHAPVYPLSGGVVERWFPVGSWALPSGLSSTGLTLGSAACAPLVAWLISQYGWRIAFGVIAPIGFVGAALWWWYSRDVPKDHPAVNEAELAIIDSVRPVATEVAEKPAWRRVLTNRDALLLMASYFCMNYVFYQMFNWVIYYLVTIRQFDPQQAGSLTSLQWIAAAIGATLGGLICDWLTRRWGIRRGCQVPAIGGLLLSATFLVLGALSGSPLIAVGALALCFLFNQLTEAAYWSAAMGVGGRHAASSCGVMNTGGNVAGFVNALLVPLIAGTLGWTAALGSGAVFALIGAMIWLWIRPDRAIAD